MQLAGIDLVTIVKIAKGATLLGRIQIHNRGQIYIGRFFTLVGLSFYNPLCRSASSVLRTEENAIFYFYFMQNKNQFIFNS